MTNEYYKPGAERAAKVEALFSRIAPRYDLLNDVMSLGLHRYWKRRLVRLARPRAGERGLDVCCGTGDLAFALARRGVRTTGLDFSARMLTHAESRRMRAATAPKFLQGDAQKLPFEDACFDIVTVGYGLRNLSDWRVGLREMHRVTGPAGRLLALDFGKPDNAVWRALYFGYLRLFVPMLGWLFCGSATAYAYILESLKHYPAQHGVEQYMRELGLRNVRIVNLLGGVMTINYGEKV
jgi:demethylmenaquinone methyltransferase/2-methoxy-6-polyprenyl-1,4-benzoquinol methylase